MEEVYTQRQSQVAENIKREISIIFQTDELGLSFDRNITVTDVKMSSGVKFANIYIMSTDSDQSAQDEKTLNDNIKHVRFVLAKRLNMRYMPNLKFFYNQAPDYAKKIEDILNSDEVKKDLKF